MSNINESVNNYLEDKEASHNSEHRNPLLEAVDHEIDKLPEEMTEKEAEALCTQCGYCCHTKVRLRDGSCIIHPTEACEFLGPDKLCTVYEDRFEKCPTCLSREKMISKDYVLPPHCPYSKMRSDYKPAKMVSEDELEYLIAVESFYTAISFGG